MIALSLNNLGAGVSVNPARLQLLRATNAHFCRRRGILLEPLRLPHLLRSAVSAEVVTCGPGEINDTAGARGASELFRRSDQSRDGLKSHDTNPAPAVVRKVDVARSA